MYRYSKVAVGGTFNILHVGHHSLIDRAFSLGKEVLVGITSDRMARSWRPNMPVRSLEERMEDVKRYLRSRGYIDRAIISVIDDRFGDTVNDPAIEAIVVSPETLYTAEEINSIRNSKGLKSLDIYVIPFVMADDGERVQARKILLGRINPFGKLDRKLIVSVGTSNRAKISGVIQAIKRVFIETRRCEHGAFVIYGNVDSEVPEMPLGEDINRGAIARARAAMEYNFRGDVKALEVMPDGSVVESTATTEQRPDFSIGIEGGLIEGERRMYGVQFAAVLDSDGNMNSGRSSGFAIPRAIEDTLRRNGYDLEGAMWEHYRVKGIGDTLGAVGVLSDGLITRGDISFQCVSAAFIYWSRNFRMTEV